jgi:hypothetical protein
MPPEPAAIQATVEAGASYAARAGIQPLCMRQENTDDDPDLEWVGLYLSSGEPPRLQGFILDGPNRYDLIPPESEEDRGLGEFPTCELEVRDLNADGRTEMAIWGHTQAGATLLHIFVWDGGRYALLGGFEGKGGIRLENRDGDLADEVVVRWRPEGELVWEVIYTWDGTRYAWTWDRYAWFYMDRPHAYPDDTPVHALASFYLALNDRDLPMAYRMLSPAARSARTYEDWALGFATTLRVEAGAVRVTAQEGETEPPLPRRCGPWTMWTVGSSLRFMPLNGRWCTWRRAGGWMGERWSPWRGGRSATTRSHKIGVTIQALTEVGLFWPQAFGRPSPTLLVTHT